MLAYTAICVFLDCWTAKDDMHRLGGTLVSSTITVRECKAACISQASCVAIDYRDESCWLHQGVNRLYNKTGVNHYQLDRKCTGKSQPFTSYLLCYC